MLVLSNMKKIQVMLISAFISLTAFTIPAEQFTVDVNRSQITWKAGKVTGEHEGTIKLSSGSLLADNKSVISGTFNINMTSINITDLKGNSRNNLLNHLKSDAFLQ